MHGAIEENIMYIEMNLKMESWIEKNLEIYHK